MVFDPTAIDDRAKHADDYDADAERDRKRDAEDDPGPPAIGSVEELDAAVRGTAAELEAAIDAKVAAADDDELFAPADDLPLVSAGQALVMEAYEGFRDPLVEPIDEREADRSVEAYLQVEAFRARLKARFEAEDAKAARVLDVLATRYGPAWRAYVLEHRRGRAKNVDTATGRIQLRKPPAKTLEVTDEDAVAEWAERCYVDGVVRWSRRVLKTALREWIDAHPGEPLPDGVDFDRGDAPDKVSIVPPKETGKK